jgi:hypothetical protein
MLGIALWLAVGGYGYAAMQQSQSPMAQAPPRELREDGERAFGTIASVGVDRFVVKRPDGFTQTVMVNDQTRYRQERQDIQLEDLKTGDRVMVMGRPGANNEFVAAMVRRVTDAEAQFMQNAGDRAFGEIVSIDKNEIKVRNRRQGEKSIVVNDQTQFVKDGQPIALKDLKGGDRIFAVGKETDGQFMASRVATGQFRGPGRPMMRQEQPR